MVNQNFLNYAKAVTKRVEINLKTFRKFPKLGTFTRTNVLLDNEGKRIIVSKVLYLI